MADIELVIKIPDNYDLSKIQNGSIASKMILTAVANGTPLPKGHGRLIDADAITKDLNTFQDAFVVSTDGTYRMAISCKAPTIIEADIESEQ